MVYCSNSRDQVPVSGLKASTDLKGGNVGEKERHDAMTFWKMHSWTFLAELWPWRFYRQKRRGAIEGRKTGPVACTPPALTVLGS